VFVRRIETVLKLIYSYVNDTEPLSLVVWKSVSRQIAVIWNLELEWNCTSELYMVFQRCLDIWHRWSKRFSCKSRM